MRHILPIAVLLLVSGCASSSSTSRSTVNIRYDESADVTEYRSDPIRLTQSADLVRYPVRMTLSAGCEGYQNRCRPDYVSVRFEASQNIMQRLNEDPLEIFVDGEHHAVQREHYTGPIRDVSRAEYPSFQLPFGVLERIATAESVRMDLGGNDITLPPARRAAIARFVQTVSGAR